MSFLEQLQKLQLSTPRLYNINVANENSEYCTHADKNKNCYLVSAINYSEDCMYGGLVLYSKDCTDCCYCDKSELCYECIDIRECYNCDFSQDLKNCMDCRFSYDLAGCMSCFGCVGLRNAKYHIFNKPYQREQYLSQISSYNLKKQENIAEIFARLDVLEKSVPRLFIHQISTENCTGDYIYSSKNCIACFDTWRSEDCLYLKDAYDTKDSAECMFSEETELCYESFSVGIGTYNCNFCNYIRGSSDCEYCELCFSCKNCFGCIGLSNKQYHILNKPYSAEAYVQKVAEIKAEMRKSGEYGKHLPSTYRVEDTAAKA